MPTQNQPDPSDLEVLPLDEEPVGKETVNMPSPSPRKPQGITRRGWLVAALVVVLVQSVIAYNVGVSQTQAQYAEVMADNAERADAQIRLMKTHRAELNTRMTEIEMHFDIALAAQMDELKSRIATLQTSGEELKRATASLIKESSDESMKARFTRWVGGQTLNTWQATFSAYRTAALNHYFPAGAKPPEIVVHDVKTREPRTVMPHMLGQISP